MKFTMLFIIPVFVYCSGCVSNNIPAGALQWEETTLEFRSLQSRKFDTQDEKKVVVACAGLLQDLGFNLTESETELGLVTGEKDRTAVEGGQVAGKVIMAALFGANVVIDTHQKMKASVVTRPVKGGIVVRVTFQRIVINENNAVSKLESLKDPKQYQEFFSKLSKSLFLTANEI